MTKLVNRAKMTTATTGTGTITLGSAVSGYQSFSAAGVANADIVRYAIEDGTNWEVGTGTYTATGTTLSRTPSESSNAGAAISLSGNASVFVIAAAADIVQPDEVQTLTNKTLDAPVVTNDLTIADKIVHTGDTDTAIRFPVADTVTVETGGVERLRVDANGNLGIGTNNPSQRLTVVGTSTGTTLIAARFNNLGLTSGSTTRIDFFSGDDGTANRTRGAIEASAPSDNNGALGLYTRSAGVVAERVRIDPTGNVGIGTISPSSKLHIVGNTYFDGSYTEKVFAVTGTTPALSPANGSIQTWTLTANSTPTAGTWTAGQSLTLMVNDSASSFTVTWTSVGVVWVGGTAPTLAPASGFTIIHLWKVGTTIYGSSVGQVA